MQIPTPGIEPEPRRRERRILYTDQPCIVLQFLDFIHWMVLIFSLDQMSGKKPEKKWLVYIQWKLSVFSLLESAAGV